MVTVTTGLISRANVCEEVLFCESTATMVKGKFPLTPGVPLIMPVAWPREVPAGRLPPVTTHWIPVAVPPVVVRVVL